MPLVPAVMRSQIAQIITQCGRTVQHQRHDPGAYSATKDYQNPTADSLLINETVTAAWIPKGARLVIEYYGILSPDDISILTASTIDLKSADLLVTDYNTSNEKVFKVNNTTPIEFLGTFLGTISICKLLTGRRVT